MFKLNKYHVFFYSCPAIFEVPLYLIIDRTFDSRGKWLNASYQVYVSKQILMLGDRKPVAPPYLWFIDICIIVFVFIVKSVTCKISFVLTMLPS